jgi:D-alanyl-D-alanine carboxypeptidase (penicillin-binding protein 5/6)
LRMRRLWLSTLLLGWCATQAQPLVTAKSALVMDAESGAVLYQKEPKATRFPASTTKIMTALLLLEKVKPGEILTAPQDTETVTGASLHLVPGETLTREDALYALLLRSANDVCHMVACHISGSDLKFAELMNERAKEIGCVNTRFNNPHGLNDDKHTSCALDLALIAREALKNDLFRRAVSAQKWTVMRSINQQDVFLTNHNKLLSIDPMVEGVKTGYTVPAGHCFVGAKSVNGWRLISVVLASKDWRADTQALFAYAYASFERKTHVEPGIVGEAPVHGGAAPHVQGRLDRAFSVVGTRGGHERPEVVWSSISAPVEAGQPIGTIRAKGVGGIVQAPILAAESVGLPPIYSPKRGWAFWAALGFAVGGAAVVARKRRYAR